MKMKRIVIVTLLACLTEAVIYPTIPSYLLPCYRSGGPALGAPRRLDVLLSTLRTLESRSQLDLRLFSAALLRSLRLDGVEQAPNSYETEFVTPFRASAFQFHKFKLLMDLFLPSQNLLQVDESLNVEEKCLLHKMISCTVRAWERGDEAAECPLLIEQRIVGLSDNTTRSYSRCPIEDGVVQTPWGTIAPGTIIATIAASLESQRVLVSDILNADVFKAGLAEPLVDISEREDMNIEIETLDTVVNTPSLANADISNVWVASIAGDLAEVVVNQGPRVGASASNMVIGSNNRWNDTVLPRHHYVLLSNVSSFDWHFTDAELLAGIDGLILASYVPTWVAQRSTIRLSQIIDMYYSNEGVSFDPQVKACNRQALYAKVFDKTTLLSEMSSFAHVLALMQGSVYVSVEEMDRMSEAAVTAFTNYVPTLLAKNHKDCGSLESVPVVDLIVATDGAWKGYDVQQFMSWVGSAIELGLEPSTLGLVHGNTGQWIAPPSKNLAELFAHISSYSDPWPDRLNYPNVLTTILQYSQNKTLYQTEIGASSSPSTVVLVISPSDRLSANEVETSRSLMTSLRVSYFDTYFAYVAQDLTGFENIINDNLDYSEVFVKTDSTSVQDAVKAIKEKVINIVIPKSIFGAVCPVNDTSYNQVPYEDYVLPGRENKYRIHPHYLTPQLTISFINSGQGNLLACSWRGGENSRNCQTIADRQTYNFNLNTPCPSIDFCVPAHFSVAAVSTNNMCANNDCRVPHQVGYYVQHTGLPCLALYNAAAETRITLIRGMLYGRLVRPHLLIKNMDMSAGTQLATF